MIQTVSEYLQKAQELKDEIIRMTETVQQRINDSTDQELRDAVDEKERQVMSYKVTVVFDQQPWYYLEIVQSTIPKG